MKYFLLFVIVLVFAWHWRSTRRADIAERKRKVHPAPGPAAGPAAGPVTMVQCAHCHLHLALPDAVGGRKGSYCSAEHRALAET